MKNPVVKLIESIAAVVMFLAGILIILLPIAVVRAWVLAKLWSWYVVSFFQLPQLPLAFAFGFSVIWRLLDTQPQYDLPVKRVTEQWLTVLLSPAILLLAGWLGTFFI